MALACALEWLRGPLMDIQGVLDMVASFFFKFQGVPVRVLPRESPSTIECLVELTHGWAVGDSAGNVSVYDFECEKLLSIYHMGHPVYTIASYGADGCMCNANSGFWVWNNLDPFYLWRYIYGPYNRSIVKLVSLSGGIAASCSTFDENVHVYNLNHQCSFLHSLKGPGRVTDIARCEEDTLMSVHVTPLQVAVLMWDARRGTHVRSIPLEFNHIHNVFVNQTTFMFIDPESCVHAFDLGTKRDSIVARADRFCVIPDNHILTSNSASSFGVVDVTNAQASDVQVTVWSNHFKVLYVRTGHVIVCHSNQVQVWM